MSITRKFDLRLNAGKSIPLTIHVSQYDQEQWVFTLYDDNGEQYVPSSGAIVGIKADNLGVIKTASVVGGNVVVEDTEQITAAAGKNVFELMIDDQTHGTANFVVLVEPKPGDNADLSESDLSLIQQAIDSTSAAAIAQGVADWMDENLSPTTPVVDASLTVSGAAADAKKTGDEISELKSQISDIEEEIEGGTGSGLTEELKSALDSFASRVVNLVEYVGFADETDGRSLIDAVSDAKDDIHNALYPPVLVTGISAVYTQSDTVYASTALNDLKSDLVVTASYSDGTSGVISDYELSGTLAVGTSTVTVSYDEFTDTFDVTVSDTPKDYEVGDLLYNWDFTKSLTDTVSGSVITLMGSATQDANGITLPSNNSYASVPNGVFALNRIVEVDVASTNAQFGNVLGRFLMTNNNDKGLIYRYNTTWNLYVGTAWTDNSVFQSNLSSKNAFSGAMLTLAIVNKPKIYKDGVLMGTGTSDWRTSSDFTGNGSLGSGSNGFYNATITGMRVYAVPSN